MRWGRGPARWHDSMLTRARAAGEQDGRPGRVDARGAAREACPGGRGAVFPGALELEVGGAVFGRGRALGGDGWAGEIAGDVLSALAVVAVDADVRLEIEALYLGAAAADDQRVGPGAGAFHANGA